MNLNKPNKILITGVNGFVGSRLADKLLENKIHVIGLCRNLEQITLLGKKGVNCIKGDILNTDEFENEIPEFDILVHTASWSGGSNITRELAWKTNVDGTANMLTLAKKNRVKKFVYISSIAVYGMNDNLLIDEASDTSFINELYTDSKIAAENLVKNSGIPYVIIRPGCIYGPRGEGWTIGVIKQIKCGFKLLGNDAGLINLSFIDNFIDGLWRVIISEDALNNIFNLNDGIVVSYHEFYTRFARMLGINNLPKIPEWRVRLSRSLVFTALRILLRKPTMKTYATHFRFNRSKFSIVKARNILNYNPLIGFNEGIYLTEKWLKEESYLD
jgi:nucleoside-diphosphate-sugar epimerase